MDNIGLKKYIQFGLWKADLLAIVCITFALPLYYKVKFLVTGALGAEDLLTPHAFIEFFYAFTLATTLVFFFRTTESLLPSKRVGVFAARLTIKTVVAVIIAIYFTRFFYTQVVDWGTDPAFEFDIAMLTILTPLLVSGIADKIKLTNKNDIIEKALLREKYENLKERVSPHFLFNCLNTLAEIIEEDTRLANQFIDNIASLYRYLLEHQDAELVLLNQELQAVESYLFLLKIRKPDSIFVQISKPNFISEICVVPFSLQILVENALKHNLYSQQEPLFIDIRIEEESIVVKNSLNKKINQKGTSEGLKNLRNRILFTLSKEIKVMSDQSHFSVELPFSRVSK